MKINLLNSKNNEISSESNCLKDIFFRKSVYKKEQKFTDLYKEILLRQKIISNIEKNIESQILNNNESKELEMTSQPKIPNSNPIHQKYANYKKKIGNIFRNKKLIAFYSLRRRKTALDSNADKEQIFKNLILSPIKDSSKNENIKLNKINKRKGKKYFSLIMRNNIFDSKLNSNIKINNNTYYFDKRKNSTKNGIPIKRNISLNQINSSENSNIIDNYNQNENFIHNNTFSNKMINDLQLSNRGTRNRTNLYSDKNSNIFNTNSSNYANNYYISNYSERKEKGNYVNKKSTYSPMNNNSKDSFIKINNISDLISSKAKLKDINSSPLNKNNKNYVCNSELKHSSKKNIIRKLKKEPFSKKIAFNKINNIRIKTHNNFKKLSTTFKNSIYKKVKSLKHITNACNTELEKLINTNNTENSENLKNKAKPLKDKIKEELDIRKDLLDKVSKNKINEGKKEKFKVLMNDVIIEMNLSEGEDKSVMNLLRKKINIISDSLALNLIEKNLGIKKNIEFDVNQLFNEHIKKKNDIQRQKIKEIRKKAENNYNKMVKLRHNLSSSKY